MTFAAAEPHGLLVLPYVVGRVEAMHVEAALVEMLDRAALACSRSAAPFVCGVSSHGEKKEKE